MNLLSWLPIGRVPEINAGALHQMLNRSDLLRRMGFDAQQLQGGMITWNRRHLPLGKEVL